MRLTGLKDEDFINYQKPCLFLSTTQCDFKCNKDAGTAVCHNQTLMSGDVITVDDKSLVDRYLANPITNAVVIAGLEPFDTFDETLAFIQCFREYSSDDIVLYTGYNEDEIEDKIYQLRHYSNIIVKFGRFISGDLPHYDEVLGINLASDNQFALRIS